MHVVYKSIMDKIAAEVREASRKGLEISHIVLNQYEHIQLRQELGHHCSFLRFPCYEEPQSTFCPHGTKPERTTFKVMGVEIRVKHIRS